MHCIFSTRTSAKAAGFCQKLAAEQLQTRTSGTIRQGRRHWLCNLGSSDFLRSLCFMWFWFGLEILRLVYKKVFLIYWTISILYVLLTSKNSTVPYKSWKKILQNWAQRVSKEAKFCADFKNVKKLPKIFSLKNDFLLNLKNSVFLQIFFPFCQIRDFCTFLKSAQNSASVDILFAQFRRNFFSTLIRGGATFFGV